MTTDNPVGAASDAKMNWPAIDWWQVHRNVRRLQARIVKAASRVPRWALERLERHMAKVIRVVLRGGGDSNVASLPDTAEPCALYTRLRDRYFIFGGSLMDSTVPADLLKLKTRLEAWRATPRYARQPIPDEFRQAAAEMAGLYSPSLVRRVLKLDPWKVKKPARVRNLPHTCPSPKPHPDAKCLTSAS